MIDKINERIRLVRQEAHLSQEAFGAKLGVSLPTMVRIEKGESLPRIDLLIKVVEKFGCDLDWLATGKKRPVGIPVLRSLEAGSVDVVGELIVPGLAEGGVALQILFEDAVPTVMRGDVVVISAGGFASSDLVVFRSPWGDTRVRRYVEHGDEKRLVAETPGVADFILDEKVKVYGRVSAVVRCIKV